MNYYTNPPSPYRQNWRAARVPGWGANPAIVGPKMIGVGVLPITTAAMARRAMVSPTQVYADGGAAGAAEPFPWIYVGAAALVLAAGGVFAYKKRLIRF